jgi:hypothetical protein
MSALSTGGGVFVAEVSSQEEQGTQACCGYVGSFPKQLEEVGSGNAVPAPRISALPVKSRKPDRLFNCFRYSSRFHW